MKKHLALAGLLAVLLGVCAVPLAAQLGTVKGYAKDENGKPIADAVVEYTNLDNGRKIEIKTNNKGEYFSVGVPPGTYSAALSVNGKVVDQFGKVPVSAAEDRIVNFDLAKDLKGAQSQVSEEEKAKHEAAVKENEKIKGLNATLKQVKDFEAAGNYDQAITTLQPVTQANPQQDLLWAYLGDAYRGAKKYPEAIDAYQKAIALKPTSGAYHSGLADAYAKSGQTDKAVQEYTAAAQAEPANAATYYFNEGAVFTNTGKVDDAIAAFDKCLAADPNRADAYYWKGVNMLGKATLKGDKMVAPDGTAEALNKYLELQPDGKYASAAKDLLASIGSAVQTTYGKQKPPKK